MMRIKVIVSRGLLLVLGIVCWVMSAGLLIAQARVEPHPQDEAVPILESVPDSHREPSQVLTFPSCLGDNLWLEMVTGYEGLYPEEGSLEPVSDVAAILVYNAGDTMLEEVEITLFTEGGEIVFFGTCLPAGERIMIMAQGKELYTDQRIYKATQKSFAMKKQPVQDLIFTDWEGKGLRLVNTGSHTLENITVFYKTYYKDLGFYLGGVTYRAYVGSLEPGEETLLPLNHYACEYSRVVLTVPDMP